MIEKPEITILQSNRSDLNESFEIFDNGIPVTLTGMTIEYTVKDECGSEVASASTTAGTITITDDTVMTISIPESSLSGLCVGKYTHGCRSTLDLTGEKDQLFVGEFHIYSGAVNS